MKAKLVLVLVRWMDSTHWLGEVVKEGADYSLSMVETVGWLVRRDEECVIVASESSGQDWRRVTAIPSVVVQEVVQLRARGKQQQPKEKETP